MYKSWHFSSVWSHFGAQQQRPHHGGLTLGLCTDEMTWGRKPQAAKVWDLGFRVAVRFRALGQGLEI